MCSLYRVGTVTVSRPAFFARWLAVCVVALLTITGDPTMPMAQAVPEVSIVETNVSVDHDAQSVTLHLSTTEVFDTDKVIPLRISAGLRVLLTQADLPKGADKEPFTVDLARFDSERNPDGSLQVIVALAETLEFDGSYGFGNKTATVNIRPRPAPPPPPPQIPTVSIVETTVNVARDAADATLNFTTTVPFEDEKLIPLTITAGNGTRVITDLAIFEKGQPKTAFKLKKSDFAAAQAPDDSLQLVVRINSEEFGSAINFGNSQATVRFADPAQPVAPSPPPSAPAAPTVSLREKEVNVDHDTDTVTLKLTTTTPFSENKSISLAITAGGRANFKTTQVVLTKGAADVEFTLKKADFATAANPDGSLQLIVKIDDTELDGSFEIGDSETIISFAAQPAPGATPPPAAPVAPPTAAAPAPTLTLQTVSTGATGTFQFTVDNAGTARTVSITTTSPDTVAAAAAITVTSGQLVITQATTTAFTFFDANCSLGPVPHPRTVNVEARTVVTEIPATGNVACTIINRGAVAHTKTVTSRFVKRRAQQLTSHIGQTRRSAGRFASGRPRSGICVPHTGTERHEHVGMRTNLHQPRAA
ncbi:MAG: prealbumin-like fold domain-containing protein, partial [Hyphomicrobiaceae bacterium]